MSPTALTLTPDQAMLLVARRHGPLSVVVSDRRRRLARQRRAVPASGDAGRRAVQRRRRPDGRLARLHVGHQRHGHSGLRAAGPLHEHPEQARVHGHTGDEHRLRRARIARGCTSRRAARSSAEKPNARASSRGNRSNRRNPVCDSRVRVASHEDTKHESRQILFVLSCFRGYLRLVRHRDRHHGSRAGQRQDRGRRRLHRGAGGSRRLRLRRRVRQLSSRGSRRRAAGPRSRSSASRRPTRART